MVQHAVWLRDQLEAWPINKSNKDLADEEQASPQMLYQTPDGSSGGTSIRLMLALCLGLAIICWAGMGFTLKLKGRTTRFAGAGRRSARAEAGAGLEKEPSRP